MKTSEDGLKFLVKEEGCILHPYNDSSNFATVGVGHLLHKSPVTDADRQMYKDFTLNDAMTLLKIDVEVFERVINNLVKVNLNQKQFDALISFTFNLGGANFKKSSLLTVLNKGMFSKVLEYFPKYCYSGGKRVEALYKRRLREAVLFSENVT